MEKRTADECWPWVGGLVMGYGAGTYGRKRYKVSREVLSEKLGRPLAPGEQALHTCDNKACCNPNHLFVGTAQDNMDDKVRKGRWKGIPPCLKGSQHGRAKLAEDDVRYIWANRGQGQTALGRRFGVSRDVINKIFTGRNWGWLTKNL